MLTVKLTRLDFSGAENQFDMMECTRFQCVNHSSFLAGNALVAAIVFFSLLGSLFVVTKE